jgi:hypothetical protein
MKLITMTKALRFDGGEIVRLKDDHPEDSLKAGDCGLIWGVYNLDPPTYEASFVDESGAFVDMTFLEDEVEELMNPKEAPFIARLEELRRMLETTNPGDGGL